MKIAIKGIYQERTEDAPFVGALICADNCYNGCENCINEDLKSLESEFIEDTNIINRVLENKFNKGIILAGLEWTLQPYEMFRLIELALMNNLEVILYTGKDEEYMKKHFSILFNMSIYIKCGRYIESLKTDDYKTYGVKLASSNQKIIKCGGLNVQS